VNAAKLEAADLKRQLQERLQGIEDERHEVMESTRDEMAGELEGLRTEIRTLRRRMRLAAAPIDVIAEVERSADLLADRTMEAEPAPPEVPLQHRRTPAAGDTVWVEPLGALGQVIQIEGDDAQVQVGPARTRVSLASLEVRAPSPRPEMDTTKAPIRTAPSTSPGVRVDLRGLASDDAVERLERHLDSAWRSGLPWVHIIHGKGTGVLRRSVRAMLAGHPLVSGYEAGGPKEGGEGVTIARLVQR
jgi:DNA mismatch repair protein MutS2